MAKSAKSSKSTPKFNNLMARVSLAWLRDDGSLGYDCFFPAAEGKAKEYIEVWLPESPFSANSVGTTQLHADEYSNLQAYYRAIADDNPGTLRGSAARQIVADLGLLRWRVANAKSKFSGRTGIRLTVFAPKA